MGHRPAELPDHHDAKRRHQTFPVHGLPPQVGPAPAPALAASSSDGRPAPAHRVLSPPSVPSFQSLPEDVLSKLADVLEEVTFFFSPPNTSSITRPGCGTKSDPSICERQGVMQIVIQRSEASYQTAHISPLLSLPFRLITATLITLFVRAPPETRSSSSAKDR